MPVSTSNKVNARRCQGLGRPCGRRPSGPRLRMCDDCREGWAAWCGAGLSGADCPDCGHPLLFVSAGMSRECFYSRCPENVRKARRAAVVVGVILAVCLAAAWYWSLHPPIS